MISFPAIRILAFALVLGGLVAGCDSRSQNAAGDSRKVFQVKGIVKEVQPDGKTVVIQHETISNYMQAMTMPFEVKDASDLAGISAGDQISFRLVVTPKEGWIEGISKLRHSENLPSRSSVLVSHAVAPLDPGDPLPDGHFTNELDQPVNLSDYKGQVLALTFIFTSCPFPNFCPRMSLNFGEVQQKLLRSPDAPKKWHLFSVTFDPKTDTPARLLGYGKEYHNDPAHWNFLTGDEAEISQLADAFGEQFWREANSITHNLRTVIVDPSGHVTKIIQGSQWTSDDLVREMIAAEKVATRPSTATPAR
jgi:protein SCO1/2